MPYEAGGEQGTRPSPPSRLPIAEIRDCPGSLLDCRTYPFVAGRLPFLSTLLGLKTEFSLPHSQIHTPNTTLTGTGLTISHGLRRPSTRQGPLRLHWDPRRAIERWHLVAPDRKEFGALREEDSLVSLAYGYGLILLWLPIPGMSSLRAKLQAFGQEYTPSGKIRLRAQPSFRAKPTAFGQKSKPSGKNPSLRAISGNIPRLRAHPSFRAKPTAFGQQSKPSGNYPNLRANSKLTHSPHDLHNQLEGAGLCEFFSLLPHTHTARSPFVGLLTCEINTSLPICTYTPQNPYKGTGSCPILELYTHTHS